MTPPEPANDERPPLWPGMSRRTEERFGFWFSIAVIAGLIAFAFAVLDARQWVGIGITLGVALVFIIGEAVYHLVVHGHGA